MVKKFTFSVRVISEYITYSNLKLLRDITDMKSIDIVGDIDLLWINDNKIECIFEVESTTSMTSALQRGSVINKDVPKIMLFPSDRFGQFERKMKTPMFSERFITDNWHFVLFEKLYKAWSKKKTELIIKEIANLGIDQTFKPDKNKDQLKMAFD